MRQRIEVQALLWKDLSQTAILESNGVEQKVSITPESINAVFQVNLPKGRSKLQGWFRDAEGKDLCGAYYALVTKLS